MSGLRQAVVLAGRDLAVEAAGRDTVVTVAPFAVAAVLLVGLGAGTAPETLTAVGPTVVWLVVLLAAVPVSGVLALQVVGINSQDHEQAARDFLDEMDAEGLFPHVADPDGQVAVGWGVFGLPETFVVDQDRLVRGKVIGLLTHEWVARTVVPLLGDQP